MIPEYLAFVLSEGTGIIHAVSERKNGNQVLGLKKSNLKVRTNCGAWVDGFNLSHNFEREDLNKRVPIEAASSGWRPCRKCYDFWDFHKEFEKYREMMEKDWDGFQKALDEYRSSVVE